MITYNKKCKGCGSILNNDKNSIGYVPKFDEKTTKYCYRCFRLKNYNELNNNEQISKEISKTISNLDLTNKTIFLIIDILDIAGSLIKLDSNLKNIIVVINKVDLLPKGINLDLVYKNIQNIINKEGFKYKKILFCSSKLTNSIKRLNLEIKESTKNNLKSIFIGKSNVGKSSLINSLMKLYDVDNYLITSNLINTTIGIKKIKLDRNIIIDTPGLFNEDNLLGIIDYDTNKLKQVKYEIRPKTYQIKYPKQFKIENLVIVKLWPNHQGSLTFYLTNNFKINTSLIKDDVNMKIKNFISYNKNNLSNDKFIEHNFDLSENVKSNISISGLGLISLKSVKKISIFINKNVIVKLLPNVIL